MYFHLSDLPDLLTVEELAAVLRIGRNSAYGLVKSNKVRSITIGRCIRIPRKALEDYINNSTH